MMCLQITKMKGCSIEYGTYTQLYIYLSAHPTILYKYSEKHTNVQTLSVVSKSAEHDDLSTESLLNIKSNYFLAYLSSTVPELKQPELGAQNPYWPCTSLFSESNT